VNIMLQIVIRILIPALIPILLGLFMSNIDKKNCGEILKNIAKENVIIHLPRTYLWIGCIEMSFTLTCLILMVNYQHDIWFELGWLILALFGAMIVAKTSIWKILIFRHESFFVYRTMFYKIYKIQYEECEYYKFGTNTFILKARNKTFFIDNKATNFEFLLAMLTQHKVKELA